MGIEYQNILGIVMCIILLVGITTIAKWLLHLFNWICHKIYTLVYGEPITPFNLFIIEDWKYEPWKDVKDRYPRKDR